TNYWQWLGSQPATPSAVLTNATNSVLIQGTVVLTLSGSGGGKEEAIQIYANNTNTMPTCGTNTASNYRVGSALATAANAGNVAILSFSLVDAPGTVTRTYYTICSGSASDTAGTVTRIDVALQEITTSDLAELYPTLQQNVQPGDVLTSDATLTSGTMKATKANDSALMGVVSTKPSQVIGGADIPSGSLATQVALSGRVPVKVTSLNGNLHVGDPITSSNLEGIGMKQTKPGKIVGRLIDPVNDWNENSCTVVDSLEEANNSWPQDTTGANSAHPCFAIPTQNVPHVPATYTQPYVYVGKLMMKVETGYNAPDTFSLDGDGQLHIMRGDQVVGASASASQYLLLDNDNNILENTQAFSDILAAHATIGSLDVQNITVAGQAFNISEIATSTAQLNTRLATLEEKVASQSAQIIDTKALANQAKDLADNVSGMLSVALDNITTLSQKVTNLLPVSSTATTSAVITNTTRLGTTASTGLAIKMGQSGDTLNANGANTFMAFQNADGLTLGKFQGNGTGGVAYTSAGSDYASYFRKEEAGEELHVGELVCLGPTYGVTACGSDTTNLVGIISDSSIIIGNNHEGDDNYVIVGLMGQMKISVSTIGGAIQNGDPLTISPITGVAQKATKAGEIIGHAIGSYTNPDLGQTGEIMVIATKMWYDPDVMLTTNGNVNILEASQSGERLFSLQDTDGNTISRVGIFSDATVGNLKAGSLDAMTLTIGGQGITDLVNVASTAGQLGTKVDAVESNLHTLQEQLNSQGAVLNMLQTLSGFNASSGAQLGLDDLTVNNAATISGTLDVLGRATFNNVGITGNLSVGVMTVNGLDDNGQASINTVGDLKLQDQGAGGIDILAGKVKIDTNGNMRVNGIFTAKKINIDTSNVLSASLGTITISAGDTQITATTSALTTSSRIFATPVDIPVAISTKRTGSNTFIIKIASPQDADLKINWWI